jgi:hypothetical protein
MLLMPITAVLAMRTDPWNQMSPRWRYGLLALLLVPSINWLPERRVIDFTAYPVLWNLLASVTGLSLLVALAICVGITLRRAGEQNGSLGHGQ